MGGSRRRSSCRSRRPRRTLIDRAPMMSERDGIEWMARWLPWLVVAVLAVVLVVRVVEAVL